MKTKIFVVCHEPCQVIKDDIYESICVGDKKAFFDKLFLRDDVGINIAAKNNFYNELTAIYWVYKHIDEFANYDNIGFVHYRRFFIFNDYEKYVKVRKDLLLNDICVSENYFKNTFQDNQILLPYLNYSKNVRKHFEKAHTNINLDLIKQIINEKYPAFTEDFDKYFGGNREFLYNMFVVRKNIFIEYCDFIFGVLFEYEKRTPLNDRLYISERLTGMFFMKLINEGIKYKQLPILFIRNRSISKGVKDYKKTKKEHKEYGMLYKTKSIWLNLMPIKIEQFLRNRTRRKLCKKTTII